jgi:hypothetical protein
VGWQLWRMELHGVNQNYQYVTVQFFNDSIKMFEGNGQSFSVIAKKAFPAMSDEALAAKRTESLKSRKAAETFYVKQIDQIIGKSDLSLGAVMGINLMIVNPGNYKKYENAESKIFKPAWQNNVDRGRTDSWSLLKVIAAGENSFDNKISYMSLDKFKDYNQLYGRPDNNSILSDEDEKVWREAFSTREIKSYRAVLIKKTGHGI